MTGKLVLLDMDGVIADQRAGFTAALQRELPSLALPKADEHYDFELNFPEEQRAAIRALRLQKGFFEGLPPIDGAQEGLAKIEARGNSVRIVTAPTWEWQHCVAEKYAWIEKHLGRDWCGKLILTRDKTLVRGDILVDDAPEVPGLLAPTWEHVLFDQPYNLNSSTRRATWQTLPELVDASGAA
jgi:5'-nucleotidase